MERGEIRTSRRQRTCLGSSRGGFHCLAMAPMRRREAGVGLLQRRLMISTRGRGWKGRRCRLSRLPTGRCLCFSSFPASTIAHAGVEGKWCSCCTWRAQDVVGMQGASVTGTSIHLSPLACSAVSDLDPQIHGPTIQRSPPSIHAPVPRTCALLRHETDEPIRMCIISSTHHTTTPSSRPKDPPPLPA